MDQSELQNVQNYRRHTLLPTDGEFQLLMRLPVTYRRQNFNRRCNFALLSDSHSASLPQAGPK
jgi:hypothetical protein